MLSPFSTSEFVTERPSSIIVHDGETRKVAKNNKTKKPKPGGDSQPFLKNNFLVGVTEQSYNCGIKLL